jgi:hypothetical protein
MYEDMDEAPDKRSQPLTRWYSGIISCSAYDVFMTYMLECVLGSSPRS